MSLLDDPSTMKMVCLLADAIAAETRPAIGGIRRYIFRAEFSRWRKVETVARNAFLGSPSASSAFLIFRLSHMLG